MAHPWRTTLMVAAAGALVAYGVRRWRRAP